METNNYKVYIKINKDYCITNIESNLSLEDTTGYIQIDEGVGDKYAHAQGNYFNVNNGEKPLRDMQGRSNYKYVNNKIVELTEEEKEILFPKQEVQPTEQEILISKIQLELEQQKQLNAQILLQIAQGGNTNV